ncbi:DNA mismatch repair protein MutS [Brochothrix campestris]|uniref:DNA mismatch repair protein MutS n=1 Tax=Brochothrix campestris TaxID=2757 RepID=UPI0038D222A5
MAYTPMIQQYLKIKEQHQDAFLFFRLGDFYEMFFEDATKASQLLEITLTARDGGDQGKIPMCGVPYHAVQGYIDRLVNKGYKIALCEQVEDPKLTKGMVKREVVQVISQGTLMARNGLNEKENNYLAAIVHHPSNQYGLAYCDLSTGEMATTYFEVDDQKLLNELSTIHATEVIVARSTDEGLLEQIRLQLNAMISHNDSVTCGTSHHKLFGETINDVELQAVSRLLSYLDETQKRDLSHLQPATHYELNRFMKIDYYSKRNLEITDSIRGKGRQGTLLWLLDETETAMGGRMLKQWLDRPLIDRAKIEQRQDNVAAFIQFFFERQELQTALKQVYDLERLSGRVAYGNVNARDLVQLRQSLQQVPAIKAVLAKMADANLQQLGEQLDPVADLRDLLEQAVVDTPPVTIKDGGMIRQGYNETLDVYQDAMHNGKSWLAALEQQEREVTGIKNLKIGYNRVFGYYIEITRSHLANVPEERYERKQTLSNAERFITPELKEKERIILEAEEKSLALEYSLFVELRETVKAFIEPLQALAKGISEIDVLQSFATVSEAQQFVRPTFSNNREMHVEAGRHPVVEKVLGHQSYVANDCLMNNERQLLLITGPNMSGKSTYMRQIALMAILAQVGCQVPATAAVLPIFDQVFTRIGAADDLISGQSTFMVEMLEANNAIQNATADSLILFDEIGRGTATYDGMALAQAMIEYIDEHVHAKTLFSTHYHELTALSDRLAALYNVHVAAIEEAGKVVFLHKIEEGPADQSYGIHVARLANLPTTLIERADTILHELEQKDQLVTPSAAPTAIPLAEKAPLYVEDETQLSFFSVTEPQPEPTPPIEAKLRAKINGLDLLTMTPMEAMMALYQLQKEFK